MQFDFAAGNHPSPLPSLTRWQQDEPNQMFSDHAQPRQCNIDAAAVWDFCVAQYKGRLVQETAIPENREIKMEIQFFPSKNALLMSFDTFVITHIQSQTLCQNLSTCYYFLWKKLNFHFWFSLGYAQETNQ